MASAVKLLSGALRCLIKSKNVVHVAIIVLLLFLIIGQIKSLPNCQITRATIATRSRSRFFFFLYLFRNRLHPIYDGRKHANQRTFIPLLVFTNSRLPFRTANVSCCSSCSGVSEESTMHRSSEPTHDDNFSSRAISLRET